MRCHPFHWLSYFLEGLKPPTRIYLGKLQRPNPVLRNPGIMVNFREIIPKWPQVRNPGSDQQQGLRFLLCPWQEGLLIENKWQDQRTWTMHWVQYSAWGSQVMKAVGEWLRSCDWPQEEQNVEEDIGMAWAEVAIAFDVVSWTMASSAQRQTGNTVCATSYFWSGTRTAGNRFEWASKDGIHSCSTFLVARARRGHAVPCDQWQGESSLCSRIS